MLNSKQKAELKKIAHSQDILKFNIGKNAIDNSVIDLLDNAITKHELIKIAFLKSALESESMNQMILDIASKLNADVVQTIGHTAILYRQNKKLPNSIKI